ncbi:uncharacterized protein LOC122992576 [Thunnus albacares]|uniref:uncharacterized protein LOC122992576 n=1 Tax=Thunnus albacares TaxID=8236 RepID=UPI001CF63E1F|nr:uncharacterized protein LOC122992576 [Thunnus albacares]
MNYLTCGLINGPIVILNIMANAFYLFCMVCPLCSSDRIKQPLKILLGSLVCCTITYLMSAIVVFFSELQAENYILLQTSYLVSLSCLSTSMTSSVWLNFFYYTQIVPARRVLFIWIKKNINSIIYCIWLLERIYNLLDFTVMFLELLPFDSSGFSNNFTTAHFLFCLCVMVMSSGSIVVYLCGVFAANGQPFPSSQFSGQVRVTVTGILQGVLYTICAVWTLYNFLSQHSPNTSINPYIHFTIINLYMSGTTFSLGAGRAVFRQRAANIWLRSTKQEG